MTEKTKALVSQKDISTLINIQKDFTAFIDYEDMIELKMTQFVETLERIGEIVNDDRRNSLNTEVTTLKKIIKEYEARCKAVTQPMHDTKSKVIAHKNAVIEDMSTMVANCTRQIAEYDIKVKKKKEQEIAKRDAEIKAANEAAKKKTELRNKLTVNLEKITGAIQRLSEVETKEQLSKQTTNFNIIVKWGMNNKNKLEDFGLYSRFTDLKSLFHQALDKCEERVNEYELARAANDANKIKQIKAQQSQEIKASTTYSEAIMKETMLEQAEEEEKDFEEVNSKLKERDELKKNRLKNLKKNFKVEAVDYDLIPVEFLKRELKMNEAKAYIKNELEFIPGVKIILQDGTEIKDKEDFDVIK